MNCIGVDRQTKYGFGDNPYVPAIVRGFENRPVFKILDSFDEPTNLLLISR